MDPWLSFLRSLVVAVGVVLGALLAFVLAVDAYGLFGTRLIPERVFPVDQRVMRNGDRVIKAVEMARSQATTVVIGSSRVALGFAPDRINLNPASLYNAGLLGARGTELNAIAHYAAREMPHIQRIILGIDLDLQFLPPETSDFPQSAFAGTSRLANLAGVALSLETVRVSAEALRTWKRGVRATFTTKGWWRWTANDRRNEALDWRSLFLQDLANNAGLTANNFAAGDPLQKAIKQQLIRNLAALRRSGVAVDLFFTPRYVWRLELERQSGSMPEIEALKRWIVMAVTEVNDCGTGPNVRVFDFDRAAPVTSEDVPAGLLTEAPRYFVETTHMTPAVGALIAAKLVSGEETGFGWQLTPSNVEAELSAARSALAAWATENAGDVAYIASVSKSAGTTDQRRVPEKLGERTSANPKGTPACLNPTT